MVAMVIDRINLAGAVSGLLDDDTLAEYLGFDARECSPVLIHQLIERSLFGLSDGLFGNSQITPDCGVRFNALSKETVATGVYL